MQTENNESNVSQIYLVPTRIVCPDTEKWPISARYVGGGVGSDSHQKSGDSPIE